MQMGVTKVVWLWGSSSIFLPREGTTNDSSDSLGRIDAEDPKMVRWVLIMARHGGGGSKVTYGLVFFFWLRSQLLMIEDYAYEGEYLCHDLELAFP